MAKVIRKQMDTKEKARLTDIGRKAAANATKSTRALPTGGLDSAIKKD